MSNSSSRALALIAVLAYIRHHEPGQVTAIRASALLDEFDMSPVHIRERTGIVIGITSNGERFAGSSGRRLLREFRRQTVPLMARDLARLAADADRGIGEKPHRLSHGLLPSRPLAPC